jgi:hypothetical protein
MAYSRVPTRSASDPNSFTDINQLQLNIDAVISTSDTAAPTDSLATLRTAINAVPSSSITATKTSDYDMTTSDNIGTLYFNTTGTAPLAGKLPLLSSSEDREIFIQMLSTGGSILTLTGTAGDLMNSQTTIRLVSAGDYIRLKGESGAWRVQDFNINYETGWINRSDWTNVHLGSDTTKNTDSDVNHQMVSNLEDLSVQMMVSTDGTDNNSFNIGISGQASDKGVQPFQTDTSNITCQTGALGIFYLDSAGSGFILDTEDWYYNIVVKREWIK